MLELGDKLYSSAPWVPRIAHYPRARLADYFATVLRQYYLHAQWHARLIGCTSVGFDLRDLGTALASHPRAVFDTSFKAIHTGRRTIPRETSHIRAWVLYAILAERRNDAYLEIIVDDGSNIDTDAVGPILIEQQLASISRNRHSNLQTIGANPWSESFAPNLDSVSVELANISPQNPGRCQTRVRAYAVDHDSGAQRGFLPLCTAVYAEMRY